MHFILFQKSRTAKNSRCTGGQPAGPHQYVIFLLFLHIPCLDAISDKQAVSINLKAHLYEIQYIYTCISEDSMTYLMIYYCQLTDINYIESITTICIHFFSHNGTWYSQYIFAYIQIRLAYLEKITFDDLCTFMDLKSCWKCITINKIQLSTSKIKEEGHELRMILTDFYWRCYE